MAGKKALSRRSFLKNSTALAAGAIAFPYIIPSSALGKAGTIAPSNRIVMGAIGQGARGGGDMKTFLNSPEVQMIAVCDVDRLRREKSKELIDGKYGNSDCKTYLDYRDLIARGDLDAVCHAMPDHWHGLVSVEAARAGLDIYGQKPLARTIKEGRAICDAVEKYGVIWQTGSQQRSGADFRKAAELVINGRIGKIKRVEVGLPGGKEFYAHKPIPVPEHLDWNFWLGPAPYRQYEDFGRGGCHWNWRWIMDYSGGQITDWAGHHIDIAHWGLGLDRTGPVEIEGRAKYPKGGLYNTPYEYRFTCKYANGIEMTVADRNQLPHGMGTTWYGEDGWLYVTRGKIEAENPDVLNEKIGSDEKRLYVSSNHYQNFLDCVKSRQEPICPAEIGHRSISAGLLCEIAGLTERKLKWDPDKELFSNDDEANRLLSRPMRSPWHL
jgi:predicted dehydrogenase